MGDEGFVLRALLVGLGSVLEIASVLNGDGLAGLGDGTAALLVSSLGNTHFAGFRLLWWLCLCMVEVGRRRRESWSCA